MTIAEVLLLGVANWLATTVLVEGVIFERPRSLLASRSEKLAYLVSCHLCTGTWVGLAQAFTVGSPWSGVAGVVMAGLVYKGLGHLVLELVATLRAARQRVNQGLTA